MTKQHRGRPCRQYVVTENAPLRHYANTLIGTVSIRGIENMMCNQSTYGSARARGGETVGSHCLVSPAYGQDGAARRVAGSRRRGERLPSLEGTGGNG